MTRSEKIPLLAYPYFVQTDSRNVLDTALLNPGDPIVVRIALSSDYEGTLQQGEDISALFDGKVVGGIKIGEKISNYDIPVPATSISPGTYTVTCRIGSDLSPAALVTIVNSRAPSSVYHRCGFAGQYLAGLVETWVAAGDYQFGAQPPQIRVVEKMTPVSFSVKQRKAGLGTAIEVATLKYDGENWNWQLTAGTVNVSKNDSLSIHLLGELPQFLWFDMAL